MARPLVVVPISSPSVTPTVLTGPPLSACPRCELGIARALPRITDAHAAWFECADCGHLWLSDGIDEQWHRHLYGRS